MNIFEMTGLFVLFIGLAAASYEDIRRRRIPNRLILIMLLIKVLLLCLDVIPGKKGAAAVIESVTGLVLGGAVFLAGYLIPGKALGAGDVKLAAAVGFYMGGDLILWAALTALAAAALFAAVGAAGDGRAKEPFMKKRLPFAPFLCVGSAAVLLGIRLL